MKVKGEGGREVSRRCPPRPEEEELVVVVFAMLPSSEQRAVGRAATGQRAGEQRATYLPVQVSRRAVALFSPLYCHSPSLRGCAGRQDKRTRELVGCSSSPLLQE